MERRINFLDVTIHRKQNKVSTDIYRKSPYTDVIIPYDSRHPKEHKTAAIHFLYNRMYSYHLSPEKMQKDVDTVHQTLYNNGYNTSTSKNVISRNKRDQNVNKVEWARFIYVGKGRRVITKNI